MGGFKIKKNFGEGLLVATLVIGITILHYRINHLEISNHIIFRELYFLPIILAGFRGGMVGGLATSFSITILYLPYILSQPEGLSGHNFGNVLQVVLFNIIGMVVGWLRDREQEQQKKRMESENLAAMGQAVSCIAHDMKTPLMAIGGFVRQVRRKITDERLAEKLDIAFAQVRRLEIMVGDMLAFARPLTLQYQQGPILPLLDEIITITEEKAGQRGVMIKAELAENLPTLAFDSHRLHQALLNLVNNAVEAGPVGSAVLIHGRRQNSRLVLEITDAGEGIPVERHGEVFKPFVTSKKDGTGLGLPITKKIIEAHGGTILILANRASGTTFRITLPLAGEGRGETAQYEETL
ncbi:MAG: DUF4118 domain-containing protein [Proteobacteria bacterium]|nr:DUF4118 domain-containing protein [Pseudomonadota bacterium]MBU1687576.1 DUF4118 domain-containing protein [Pseudomonadota bacterium]